MKMKDRSSHHLFSEGNKFYVMITGKKNVIVKLDNGYLFWDNSHLVTCIGSAILQE